MGVFTSESFGMSHIDDLCQTFPGVLPVLVQRRPGVTTYTELYCIKITSNNRTKSNARCKGG